MGTEDEGGGWVGPPKFPFMPADFPISNVEAIKFPSNSGDVDEDPELSPHGVIEFEWGLRGLDCPDCAMKATTVVRRVPGVKEAIVSATEGRVRVKLDVSLGRTSRVNSVLSGLGHPPDIEWEEAIGVVPTIAAAELGIDRHKLESRILELPGVLGVRTENAVLELQRSPIQETRVRNYSGSRLNSLLGGHVKTRPSQKIRLRDDQKQLISAVMTIPALAILLVMDAAEVNNIIPAIFTTIVILFTGQQMFKSAISSFFNLVFGFQLLTSLAVIGAFLLGEWFESVIVTGLVALASYIEERTLSEARNAMQGGLDRLPTSARVVSDDKGKVIEKIDFGDGMTPIDGVIQGDHVEIRSGEVIPVDGIILEGSGLINRAPLTGEPIPIPVKLGDQVEAGLTLVRGPVIIRADDIGKNTRLYSLIELVRRYKETPSKTQSIIEQFTAVWVPFVLISSIAYGLYSGNMVATLILWVVSCPCALLLAAPVPHATALSASSAAGVVARGGDIIENIASADLVLLDKTGTLTSGRPTIHSIDTIRGIEHDYALSVASGLEKKSNHPYAETIISEAGRLSVESAHVRSITDGEAGVSGTTQGKNVVLGSYSWVISKGFRQNKRLKTLSDEYAANGMGSCFLGIDGRVVALFTFRNDDIRQGASDLIRSLRENKMEIQILSGDQQSAVEKFADSIGVPPSKCRGDVTPEGKAQIVRDLTAARSTIMAGDGFNDSGALAAATVGIAMGSGEQINLEAADVLIPGQDPNTIAKLIQISKRTRLRVSVNIAISMCVTAILVLTTIFEVNSSIAIGIALHEASVFFVILNGMLVKDSGESPLEVVKIVYGHLRSDIAESFKIMLSNNNNPATTS